jgi:hypothetical protein
MPLTPVQLVRIATLRHHDDAVTNDERLRLIADAESAEELHRVLLGAPPSMAEVSRLAAVVTHAKCAQGTAHFVYWALSPGSYYWILKKRKPLSERSEHIWALLMCIEKQVRAQRYTGEPIEFSFLGFIGRSLEAEALSNPGILSVPEFMRSDVAGSRIE